MANFTVFLANYAEIVESIQARRIRVKLSIVDQRPEGKKRRKYKEIGAPAKLVPVALCTTPALFHLLPVPAFYTMPCLHLFLVFSYFNPCNSFYFGLFCNLTWL